MRRDLFSISRGKKLTYGIISVSHKALKGRLIKGALFLGGGGKKVAALEDLIHDTMSLHLQGLPFKGVPLKRH